MKHGVFTVLLPEKNLEEVFRLLGKLGYDGVELRVRQDYHVPPEKILSITQQLAGLMKDFNLEIPVLATYLSVTDIEPLLQVFEAADLLGSTGVRVSLGPALDGTRTYWQVADEVSRQLEVFLKAVRPFRAKALFEIHCRTLISSPSLAFLLLRHFDPEKLGVIFDPANMIVEGREGWKIGMEVIGEYLGHVHVKNASWHKNRQWTWAWDDLDAGMVDWAEVIRELTTVPYQGYLSNENLSGVILPGATGFIGERLSGDEIGPSKPMEAKLAEDLQFLRDLERTVRPD